VARPFKYLGVVLNDVINESAMKGGCFLYSSTAYSLTRLLTGQLAAVIDVGNRILRDHPETRSEFLAVGGGRVVSLFTYDIAAAALIAQEAGAVVTDAFGSSLSSVPLLDSSEGNLVSICAASTKELHTDLLLSIERGSGELGRLLGSI
jgi:myo-inositol-1(or 4)-monophosphatase